MAARFRAASRSPRPLAGRIVLVAGATRGAGRGIAISLGEAGATVYCSGRSTREAPSPLARPETIEDTAELVTAADGTGIAVRVDHSVRDDAIALMAQVERDHRGLDVLVNDVWGGGGAGEWLGKPIGARPELRRHASETPRLVGRAIAALAADHAVMAMNGQIVSSWELANKCKLDDVDGTRPDWLTDFCRHTPPRHPARTWMQAGLAWQGTVRQRTRAFLKSR